MTYEPAMYLRLRVASFSRALYVIMAADGTVLDAMEETLTTLPRWVAELVQLPTVDVTPAVYRQSQRDYAALR
jgi:hypothetical protein